MSKVFVFGHRNPDTDAIASAIAMAHLERTLDPTRDVEAVALGSPGPETRYALDHFGVEAPRVIERSRPEADGVMPVSYTHLTLPTKRIV